MTNYATLWDTCDPEAEAAYWDEMGDNPYDEYNADVDGPFPT